jgi:hypothetical protein
LIRDNQIWRRVASTRNVTLTIVALLEKRL